LTKGISVLCTLLMNIFMRTLKNFNALTVLHFLLALQLEMMIGIFFIRNMPGAAHRNIKIARIRENM